MPMVSPRRLALLCLITSTFLLTTWLQSPWYYTVTSQKHLFTTPPQQRSLHAIAKEAQHAPTSIPPVSGFPASRPQQSISSPKPRSPPWETGQEKGAKADHVLPMTEEEQRVYMRDMMNWNRPSWGGHWPPFGDYVDLEYDPNRWEQFDIDYTLYKSGWNTLGSPTAGKHVPYKPLPSYNSDEWKRKWKGEYAACEGARGFPLNTSSDDQVKAYQGLPSGFSKVFAGGYDIVGLDDNVCFDRYGRYGAYAYGSEAPSPKIEGWDGLKTLPVWEDVQWGNLQDKCLDQNRMRYRPGARESRHEVPSKVLPHPAAVSVGFTSYSDREDEDKGDQKYHARTAVLIRSWTGYQFEDNDIMAIRAMVSELSLQSGGEYTVYLFVHVKDSSLPILTNRTLYNEVLVANVPRELRSIALLWSESIFSDWYPHVGDWQVYWQQFMCVQWFAITHPEFDYVWNWETDARYIGHHYHFLEKVSEFAEKQPRKLLWERNKRYYLPAVHGSYRAFVEQTHRDVLNASAHSLIPPLVWGPRPYARAVPPQVPLGPTPPRTFEEDAFEWGVDEPADIITLLPMWDPRNTSWSYKDKIWNYVPDVRPIFTTEDGTADRFTHPDFVDIDRRVFINTVVRFSKRMLQAMHEENLAGRSMQAEMWPSTVALQHGLKAVYAPHPIFNDRNWPSAYVAGIFDTSNRVDSTTGGAIKAIQGAWTEQGDSPYNHDREVNFQGWSWYFASRFPRNLYRRWLNWPVAMQDWGEDERIDGGEGADGERDEKRMCLPGMLLHPIKRMQKDLVKP